MKFEVVEPEVEELEEGPAEVVAVENARQKAASVAGGALGSMVLGVDTIVSMAGRIYGKPTGAEEAGRTLRDLSGRRHVVISGLCLIEGGQSQTAASSTAVEFRVLDEELIEWYVGSGEWHDRAGGYAIQGRGAALVNAIEGDYLNVVGLPVATLLELAPWLLYRTA